MADYRNKQNSIPQLHLERWLTGNLNDRDKQKLKLRFDEELISSRLGELEQENRDFWQQNPFQDGIKDLKGRLRPVDHANIQRLPGSRRMAPLILLPLALIASLLLWVVPQRLSIDSDTILVKGDNTLLFVYKKTLDGAVRLSSGDILKPGDVVQLAYESTEAGYGMIFSVDSQGVWTLHFPEGPSQSNELKTGARIHLNSAYRLDASPRFERFYFIRSQKVFDTPSMERTLRSLMVKNDFEGLEKLPIDKGFEQSTFLIRKGNP
ncbi:MAG: DUF4384 domain-containing protein [Pseudobdellovibrionaceae bacterium]|nr:DUF4384 domain-containing protein [Pseudobdellovibrionaceae bacterium]